ncbi:MAG TPA: CSLREA domain-containing protein, partial [Gemmatimonadales bacterium]|nr:CSLREA domain-containing protein [Gemmatimonadales bacterium]
MLTGQPRRRPIGAAFLPCALTLGMAACDDHKPTPTAPSDPGLPTFDHTASHLVVNSVADPGTGGCTPEECTLREAITAANQDPDPSEISFARKFTAAIRLDAASGQLAITEDLSITGPKGGIVIQRTSGSPEFRIFDISKDLGTATVRFTQLTIRGGQSLTRGGGIRNVETLTLANSVVSDNAAATSGG